jgi:hypothetical protein
MRQSIRHLSIGLALFLAGLAGQGLGQSAPQQVVGTGWQALTETPPAVAVGQGKTEYMAWKGASSNQIYFSAFNGSEWSQQQEVRGIGPQLGEVWSAESSAAPSLSWFPPFLWLSWQASNGGAIMYSSWGGGGWSDPLEVSGTGWTAETGDAPAFDGFDNIADFQQLVAWKGASSNSIWFSYTNPSPAAESIGWTGQQTVGGSGWTAESNVAPTLENTAAAPYLFWKGASSDHIWGSFAIGGANTNGFIDGWNQQTEISCGDPQWAAETNASPAAAPLGLGMVNPVWDVVVWKGSSDNTLWYTYDGNSGCQWAHQRTVSGSDWSMNAQTNVAPALAFSCGCNELGIGSPSVAILAWKNATDNTIWFLNPTTLPGLSGLEHGLAP